MNDMSFDIQTCYAKLSRSEHLVKQSCQAIQRGSVPEFQLATLALRLFDKQRNRDEDDLLGWILREHRGIWWLISQVEKRIPLLHFQTDPVLDDMDLTTLRLLSSREPVGHSRFAHLITRYLAGDVAKLAMAFVLGVVCMKGLHDEDTAALTRAMVESGKTFDQRPFAERKRRRLLRRYPTGGISEKVALIMPSLLLALADEIPLMSTTIVGRSLGFTGGTWDKLSVVPGFIFPGPGEDTELVLDGCNVAMCTTGPELAPADQELYLLRSQTGTIVSEPLIISSIASKHIALPPHRILLDIRFGPGAFLDTRESARSLASKFDRIFTAASIQSSSILVDTSEPSGSAVGNAVEILEAIAVMGGAGVSGGWDSRGLGRQRELVIEETLDLCCAEFPLLDRIPLRERISALFGTGAVFDAFCRLLRAHCVTEEFVQNLRSDSRILLEGLESIQVTALESGRLTKIDQKRLGDVVNVGLALDQRQDTPGKNRSGVWLRSRVGDYISSEQPICTAVIDKSFSQAERKQMLDEVRQCFEVRAEG